MQHLGMRCVFFLLRKENWPLTRSYEFRFEIFEDGYTAFLLHMIACVLAGCFLFPGHVQTARHILNYLSVKNAITEN